MHSLDNMIDLFSFTPRLSFTLELSTSKDTTAQFIHSQKQATFCESLYPFKVRIPVSNFDEAKDFDLRTHSEHTPRLLRRKSQTARAIAR